MTRPRLLSLPTAPAIPDSPRASRFRGLGAAGPRLWDLLGTEHRKGQDGEGRGADGGRHRLQSCGAGVVAEGPGGAASPPPSEGHMRGAGGWAKAVAAAGTEAGLGGQGRGGGARRR